MFIGRNVNCNETLALAVCIEGLLSAFVIIGKSEYETDCSEPSLTIVLYLNDSFVYLNKSYLCWLMPFKKNNYKQY